MKSTAVAYILCILGFFAVAGLHRFYAGKWITGLIWLFTDGLLVIGTIVDLFLIPGMIERANINRRLDQAGF
jgi:TM2 domain-containing membrane protein YozV